MTGRVQGTRYSCRTVVAVKAVTGRRSMTLPSAFCIASIRTVMQVGNHLGVGLEQFGLEQFGLEQFGLEQYRTETRHPQPLARTAPLQNRACLLHLLELENRHDLFVVSPEMPKP